MCLWVSIQVVSMFNPSDYFWSWIASFRPWWVKEAPAIVFCSTFPISPLGMYSFSQVFLFLLHCLCFLWYGPSPSWWFTGLYGATGFMSSPTCCFSTKPVGQPKRHDCNPPSSNTGHSQWKLYLYVFNIILPGLVFAQLPGVVPVSP